MLSVSARPSEWYRDFHQRALGAGQAPVKVFDQNVVLT